ncbi:MAG: Glu-tRNA(Gln) amidotransferase subunit GatE [archaeon]
MDFDYKALGLKCGLECHQQLDTGKLFSRTPSMLREDSPHYRVERKLRPVVSEFGEYDKAALEAFKKGLTYVYEGYNDTTSLVELDEEPPQECDKEALHTILEVALLAESKILDELFTMRKAVIDGSNTSGFQRTMLVSTGGKIKMKNKELGIQTIVLEEDAARPVEKTNEKIVYRLDRLGIPLIELATEPSITTPEEAKEAARAIGKLFRITCRAKRGLGTIRQDLNVSIREGARVEIKGVQELEIIDEYVRREIQRQYSLIAAKKELEKKGAKKELLKFEPKNIGKIFEKTGAKILKSTLEKKDSIMALKLPEFAGILGKELQPNRRVGTELSDNVKTKTGLKGLFHSDELPNYGITQSEVDAVRKELGCGSGDAFIIIAGPQEKALHGIEAALERAKQCLEGVPEETRGAIEGGNTEYLRPLPGAARMYPETDLDPIIVDKKTLKEIKKDLPLGTEQRKQLYAKWGLNEKHCEEMKLSNYARFFERLVQKEKFDAKKTAVFLLETLVEARREGINADSFTEPRLEEFLKAMESGKIMKEVALEMLTKATENPFIGVEELVKREGHGSAGTKELEQAIRKIVQSNSAMVKEKGMNSFAALMGDTMKELRGKASGSEISTILKKEIQSIIGQK